MPPSRRGSGFVNLQTYLGLNQSGGASLGNSLAQDVSAAGAKAGQSISDSATRFTHAKQAAIGTPTEGMTAAELEALKGREYSGPRSLDLTGDQINAVADADKRADMLGSNTGRAQLLQEKYGANSWGGSQLDAALAGGSSAGTALGQAQSKYGRLLEQLGGVQKSVGTLSKSLPQELAARDARVNQLLPGAQQREQDTAQQAQQQQALAGRTEIRQGQQQNQQQRDEERRRLGRQKFEQAYPSYP